MIALPSDTADAVRVMLHTDDDSTDVDYVNTEEGDDYINASYVNVYDWRARLHSVLFIIFFVFHYVSRVTTNLMYSL